MGLLCGYLAAAAVIAGLVCIVGKKHLMCVLFGAAEIALTVLSILGLRDMMLASGKILTPELFGFGYHKPVFAVYVIMLILGAVYVLTGAYGIVRGKCAVVQT